MAPYSYVGAPVGAPVVGASVGGVGTTGALVGELVGPSGMAVPMAMIAPRKKIVNSVTSAIVQGFQTGLCDTSISLSGRCCCCSDCLLKE